MEKRQLPDRISSKRSVKRKEREERLHVHEFHELYYMLEGKTIYYIDGKAYDVEKGDIVFVPKGTIHDTDYKKGRHSERLLLFINDKYFEGTGEQLRSKLQSMRVVHVPADYLEKVEGIFAKITEEDHQFNEYKDVMLESYIKILLVLICRWHSDQDFKVHEGNKIVREIADYINEHYGEDLSLSSISKIFSINEAYLSRKFKEVSGMGISKYITKTRIDMGARLLMETEMTVTSIAEQCGFNDSNYFAAVFKKMKGVTPMIYKKYDGWIS